MFSREFCHKSLQFWDTVAVFISKHLVRKTCLTVDRTQVHILSSATAQKVENCFQTVLWKQRGMFKKEVEHSGLPLYIVCIYSFDPQIQIKKPGFFSWALLARRWTVVLRCVQGMLRHRAERVNGGGGGGGGGFFLACEDLGRMFNHSFPACTLFFLLFFKWRLAHAL